MRCANGGKWKADPNCPPGSQMFNSSGTFTVPTGTTLTAARVLIAGGGGGGACGNYAGGGSGYVACGTFDLSNVSNVTVVVGTGGIGGGGPYPCGTIVLCVSCLRCFSSYRSNLRLVDTNFIYR